MYSTKVLQIIYYSFTPYGYKFENVGTGANVGKNFEKYKETGVQWLQSGVWKMVRNGMVNGQAEIGAISDIEMKCIYWYSTSYNDASVYELWADTSRMFVSDLAMQRYGFSVHK